MAGYQNLNIRQGEDFNTTITLYDDFGEPYNLTGFSVASQAKSSYYTTKVALVFNSTLYDANNGVIQLTANWNATANLDARIIYVYDVFTTDPTGIRTCVLEGQVIVLPSATIPNTAFGSDV
jgi:hypothetical protein